MVASSSVMSIGCRGTSAGCSCSSSCKVFDGHVGVLQQGAPVPGRFLERKVEPSEQIHNLDSCSLESYSTV